ncbi:NADP-dependent oxidoreductase domain-containing protein [Mycena metata]|uniref:NADP-dependent oxidoreductase domain-containing protein n=1 Tax=Mycena metata TaxID=1033252 RepID=A0AAD7N332_9AGAR|nr:NADP-dependent oxidoreductase domain-containing protein [Mycena metata]
MAQQEYPLYETKGMPFRRLGPSGLRVPLLSLGGWLTLGGSVTGDPVKEIIQTAFENGINMFDTAEAYAKGQSEIEMCGTQACLERLQMNYVDVIFAHRCDCTVPMEEIVRAFNYVIEKGWAFYWGTSEWSAQEIEEAHHIATKLNLIAPIAEQCQHSMFHRERPEKEYDALYRKYGYGTTLWSPLASSLLTGKYNNGIPEGSRFATVDIFKTRAESLEQAEGLDKIEKVKKLTKLAESTARLHAHRARARGLAKNPNTSTIILGVSSAAQLLQNLEALKVLPKITAEHLAQIEEILDNKPEPFPTYSRPALDVYSKLSRCGVQMSD